MFFSSFYGVYAIPAVVFAIDLFLYRRLRTRRYDRKALRNELLLMSACLCVLLTGFFCYVFFFDAYQTSFVCSKKTMTCLHREATLFKPYLHDVKTLGLSGVSSATVSVDEGRSTRYRIVFVRNDGSSFRFPVTYRTWSRDDLAKELRRINAFLKTDKEDYSFYETHAKPDLKELFPYMFFFFLIAAASFLMRALIGLLRNSEAETNTVVRQKDL